MIAGKSYSHTITDSSGRHWRTEKDTIEQLADLMNEQSIYPLQTSDELFHIFDAALTTEEIEFMLLVGGGSHTFESLKRKTNLKDKDFERILSSLLHKGPFAIIRNENNEKVYHIMSIFPGWFEFFMMRGVDDEEHRLFAQRIEKLFTAAYAFGNEDVINDLVKAVGPHLTVSIMDKKDASTIQINENINKENHVYSAGNITSFFNMLDDNEFISVGHCLCRYEKELIGDHCRVDMPMETCISVGPAAEYLIEQGISRKISRIEALTMIKNFQDKGCIHQTGRTIPLKDFKSKYPVDVICNCCWDCCGVVGNYNRGYLPLTVTSYYRASIPDSSLCTGCGQCVEFCPVGIIRLNEEGKAVILNELCIGCGQCQYHCPTDAVFLNPDNRIVFLPMLGKDGARIKPPKELDSSTEESSDSDGIKPVSRDEVLKVLEETREKLYRPDIHKVFKKWNKTMLYHFTDFDEYWYFIIKDGMPGPLKQGALDDPEIHYTLTGSVFVGLMRKEIDGFKAFRKKLVQVKAPVMDLIKLQKLIG